MTPRERFQKRTVAAPAVVPEAEEAGATAVEKKTVAVRAVKPVAATPAAAVGDEQRATATLAI